ncbi:MAG: glucosidase, partial [Gemmatimonadota bacterium]
LARFNPAYSDVASKFFEHFVAIDDAMNALGGSGLWDEEDGFYYDQLHTKGEHISLKVRSMVGLIPLFACEILEEETIAALPGFSKRMHWFLENHPALASQIETRMIADGDGIMHEHRLLSIPSRERLERVLRYLLDESEFLSPFGIRSVSKVHAHSPYVFRAGTEEFRVGYDPGESTTGLFGGNSNWRGPIWFPLNYLLIEALERFAHFYGDTLTVECPVGSGTMLTLDEVARELSTRLSRLFLPANGGHRPVHGAETRYATDEAWSDLVLFYEYFHGDTGRGVGASHQTGWTALITRCLETVAASRHKDKHSHHTEHGDAQTPHQNVDMKREEVAGAAADVTLPNLREVQP